MSLTSYEMHLIADIDRKFKHTENNFETVIFHNLMNLAPTVKNLLYSHEEKEMDLYLQAYEGFRDFLSFLQSDMIAII